MNQIDIDLMHRWSRCYGSRWDKTSDTYRTPDIPANHLLAICKSQIHNRCHYYLTVSLGTSAGLLTYTYKVGPSGVGWGIPSPSDGSPLPPQPSELPGPLIIPSVPGDSNTTLSSHSASDLHGLSSTATASAKSSTENSTRDPTKMEWLGQLLTAPVLKPTQLPMQLRTPSLALSLRSQVALPR